MKVFLTGATGYIGAAVLTSLIANGHEVTAAVRSEAKADAVRATGASAVVVSLTDKASVGSMLRDAEGVIHTASGPDVDPAFLSIVIDELWGSPTQFVHTSGIWLFGPSDDITEESAPAAPEVVAWRAAQDAAVTNANVNSAIVAPAVVFGGETAITEMFASDGAAPVRLVGDGGQRWALVHVDDLADLYVRVLEKGASVGYVIASNGENPTVRDIAAARSGGADLLPESPDESRARLGAGFADALLASQAATGAFAREAYGWAPTRRYAAPQ